MINHTSLTVSHLFKVKCQSLFGSQGKTVQDAKELMI